MVANKNKSEAGDLIAEDLIGLSAARKLMNSRVGEERGEYGRKVAALQESGLDIKVFNAIISLTKGKNAASITTTLNRFTEYVDMMGLRDQADIESYLSKMPDTRTEYERAADGELGKGAVVVAFDAGKGKGKGKTKGDKAAGKAATDAAISPVPPAPDEGDGDKLATFKQAMDAAHSPAAVNRGLQAFLEDQPAFEDQAIEIAEARIKALPEAE